MSSILFLVMTVNREDRGWLLGKGHPGEVQIKYIYIPAIVECVLIFVYNKLYTNKIIQKIVSRMGVEKNMTDNLKVKAKKALDDVNVAAHAAVDDAKVAVHNIGKDAGEQAPKTSDDVKTGLHKAVSDAKIATHQAASELKKK